MNYPYCVYPSNGTVWKLDQRDRLYHMKGTDK
jgi:hypothetical protein